MYFNKNDLTELKAPEPFTRYAKIFFDDTVIADAPLSLAVFRYEPGQEGPEHVHEDKVEVYYCLKGKGTVIVDEKEYLLEAGSALYIPPEKYHETKNTGNEVFEFLGIFAPCENFDSIRQWSK
jgi:quercetin dioxygenase-like cupin family protein